MNKHQITAIADKVLDTDSIIPLKSVVYQNERLRYSFGLVEMKGLYAFWLENVNGKAEQLNRSICIKGPGGKLSQPLKWDWGLKSTQILLYVGKTSNLRKRLSLHLKMKTTEWPCNEDNSLHKRTTSCQLRAGLEHLYKTESAKDAYGIKNFHDLLSKDYLGLTYIEESHFSNRFYAEDLAVGIGMPWFNVDSER